MFEVSVIFMRLALYTNNRHKVENLSNLSFITKGLPFGDQLGLLSTWTALIGFDVCEDAELQICKLHDDVFVFHKLAYDIAAINHPNIKKKDVPISTQA